MIKIGEVIKRLRKESDLTQEELAEYLNISSQAVSKWENGTAFPDIAIIPAIANFFNVSTDFLFSMDENIRNSEINKVLEEYQQLYNKGNLSDAEKLLRDSLSRYPNNYQLLIKLCNMIFWNSKTDDIQRTNELIQKCELILKSCMVDDIRNNALRFLALGYERAGKHAKAVETANRLSSRITKEDVLTSVLNGDERTKQRQENILFHIDQIFADLFNMAREQNDPQINLYYNILSVNMMDLFFENKDYHLYHTRLQFAYMWIAASYAKLQDFPKAFENLRLAAKHVKQFDRLEDCEKYTSKSFNLCTYKKGGRPYSGTTASQMAFQLTGDSFNSIRNTPEFQEILSELK